MGSFPFDHVFSFLGYFSYNCYICKYRDGKSDAGVLIRVRSKLKVHGGSQLTLGSSDREALQMSSAANYTVYTKIPKCLMLQGNT